MSPDGEVLVLGEEDQDDPQLRLVALADGSSHALPQGTDWATCGAFRGPTFYSNSQSGALRAWEVSTGALQHTVPHLHPSYFALYPAPDPEHVISAGNDGTLALWRFGQFESPELRIGDLQHFARFVTIDPAHERIAIVFGEGLVEIRDARSGLVLSSVDFGSRASRAVFRGADAWISAVGSNLRRVPLFAAPPDEEALLAASRCRISAELKDERALRRLPLCEAMRCRLCGQ
jgi:WD40 repeat protein